MADDVVSKIVDACNELGDVQLAGIKLEEASPALLDVTQFSIDQHVAMQPAAIAYYSTLKKEAARRLTALENQYDRWQKKQYSLAKAAIEATVSNRAQIKVEDVKARFVIDNEVEIERREAEIAQARAEYDTLDSWYEAWKQKSFSIRETVAIEEEERYNTSTSIMGKKEEVKRPVVHNLDKIREVIRRKYNGK